MVMSNNLSERQKEVLNIYHRFNKANKHKMIEIPVCLIPENLKSKFTFYYIYFVEIAINKSDIKIDILPI